MNGVTCLFVPPCGLDTKVSGTARSGTNYCRFELGMGVLFGVTEATPDVTLKWDLGISF
jgi:hypothetical protein